MKPEGPYILTIDAGTGDCRVIAYSVSGEIAAEERTEWFYLPSRETGYYEFEAERCIGGILSMLGRIVAQIPKDEIAAITVTSQRDGMAFLDRSGQELYCAPNLDLRGQEVLEKLVPYKREIMRTTGLPLHAMFGLPRLIWFRENEPEAYSKIDCVLMISDWIAYRLTGNRRSEAAIASTSQMLNLADGNYDKPLMREMGLKDTVFPVTCRGTEEIGRLKSSLCSELGIDHSLPVYIAGSDAHCAAVGMGCIHPGDMAVIAGSTTPILAVADRPIIDPEGCLYASPASLPGQWTIEGNADSSGLSYRWLKNLMYGSPDAEQSSERVYAKMEADAEAVNASADGLTAFVGIGIRNVKKGKNFGGFCFPVPWNIDEYGRGHFVRAVLESNAYAVAANIELITRCTGRKPSELRVCGGQTASPIWCRTLASAAGLPLRLFQNPEATALGAAMMAAVGCGLYADAEQASEKMVSTKRIVHPEAEKEYRELYAEWKTRYFHLLDYDADR